MVVNIGSRAETETERILSNFAHTPFTLYGELYESVEGFWQSLKFSDPDERRKVARLWGIEAKRAGRDAPKADTFLWNAGSDIVEIQVGSPQHRALMRQALRMKFRRNPRALKLLLATGDEPITHVLHNKKGEVLPDSKTIPAEVLCGYLMEIRAEFRAIHGTGEHIMEGSSWR